MRLEWVKNVSSAIEIPLTVGGGISNLKDIKLVLDAGADKISMNNAAVKNPNLVKEAVKSLGSEKITMAIDGKRNKQMPSGFEVVISGGAGTPEHFYEGVADILLAASVFHFRILSIKEVKEYLRGKGLKVNL